MKILIVSLFAIIFLSPASAQQPNYRSDFTALYKALQKTPSFKAQMKGQKKRSYDQLYRSLSSRLHDSLPTNSAFHIMSQLLLPLRDNHLYFYQVPEAELDARRFVDSNYVAEFNKQPFFMNFPRIRSNLDSLRSFLAAYSPDSIPGIYFYNNFLKAGVYRTSKPDSLVGVVLESWLPNWKPGEILFTLQEHAPNRFFAINAQIVQKTPGLVKNVKFMHHRLTELGFKKDPLAVDHVNLPVSAPTFSFHRVDRNISYLRLGSFATYPQGLKESAAFFDTVSDSLTGKSLIVDIRNNGGGGFKASGKYLDLLKQFTKVGWVYLITNDATVSNAEEFTMELMKNARVTTLGETTNGKLTYGNNRGVATTLPSKRFALYITDMKGSAAQLAYEESGITPQVLLDTHSGWIGQVIDYIKQRSD